MHSTLRLWTVRPCWISGPRSSPGSTLFPYTTLFRSGSSRAATPWSPVFVQVRTCYPTYPTRCQHEGDGKREGQSTRLHKCPIATCHCIHVWKLRDISHYTYIHLFPY